MATTTAEEAWTKFVSSIKGATLYPLAKAVHEQLGGDDYATQQLAQVRSGNDGWNGFIYYEETEKFYNSNRQKVLNYAKELAVEFGESLCQMVANFNSVDASEDEIALTLYGSKKQCNIDVANALAWFALEEVAYHFQEFLRENDLNFI